MLKHVRLACKFKEAPFQEKLNLDTNRIEALTELVLEQKKLIMRQAKALDAQYTNSTTEPPTHVGTINNVTNNITNNVQNITYNVFGKEDLSFLDKDWVRIEAEGPRDAKEIMIQAFREAYCDPVRQSNFVLYPLNINNGSRMLVRDGVGWGLADGSEVLEAVHGRLIGLILDRQPTQETTKPKVVAFVEMEQRGATAVPYSRCLKSRHHGSLSSEVVKKAMHRVVEVSLPNNKYVPSTNLKHQKERAGCYDHGDPEIEEVTTLDQTVGGDDDFMDGIQAQFGRVTPAVLPPPEKKNEPENTLRFGCELLGVSELLGALAESKGSDERALQRMIRSLWGSGRTLRAGKLPGEVRLLRPGGIWETSSILEVVSVLFDKIHATGEGVRLLTAQPRWLSTVGDWWPEL
jgi:hypothetical protein